MLNSHCREKSINRVLSNLSLHSTLPWIDALSFCHSPFENITLSSSGAALDNIPHFSLATKEAQGNERALSCHGIQTQFCDDLVFLCIPLDRAEADITRGTRGREEILESRTAE